MVKTLALLPEPLVVSGDIITEDQVDGVDVSDLQDQVNALDV